MCLGASSIRQRRWWFTKTAMTGLKRSRKTLVEQRHKGPLLQLGLGVHLLNGSVRWVLCWDTAQLRCVDTVFWVHQLQSKCRGSKQCLLGIWHGCNRFMLCRQTECSSSDKDLVTADWKSQSLLVCECTMLQPMTDSHHSNWSKHMLYFCYTGLLRLCAVGTVHISTLRGSVHRNKQNNGSYYGGEPNYQTQSWRESWIPAVLTL